VNGLMSGSCECWETDFCGGGGWVDGGGGCGGLHWFGVCCVRLEGGFHGEFRMSRDVQCFDILGIICSWGSYTRFYNEIVFTRLKVIFRFDLTRAPIFQLKPDILVNSEMSPTEPSVKVVSASFSDTSTATYRGSSSESRSEEIPRRDFN
jgi:hypothetical protein